MDISGVISNPRRALKPSGLLEPLARMCITSRRETLLKDIG
jgi:hypothetical protein